MLAPVTHILPVTHIQRTRRLPTDGRVLVRTNQKVNATDVVAEAHQEGKHILVNVRRALGLASTKETDSLIERKVGEKIQKGDVIARTGRAMPKVVRAPENGEIVAINNGQVLLEVESKLFQLRAGFSGNIVDLLPDRGVIIEAHGALVQGIWGNNQIDQGLLLVLAQTAGEALTRDRLDVSLRGAVILGGYCTDAEALKMANELPLRGLILGGMAAGLIPLANKLVFPLIVVDGFGPTPMNAAAFKLLSTNEKRETCLNAAPWNLSGGERPEVIIPLPVEGNLPKETDEFKPEQVVRIQGAPYTGQIATLVRVRPWLTALPNGLRVPAGDVRLESTEVVSVPLANLDVLE
jgi:hypothetical protein